MTYGERILIERRRKGVTQEILAKLCGLKPQTIVDVERDNLLIAEEQFHRFMAALAPLPARDTVAA